MLDGFDRFVKENGITERVAEHTRRILKTFFEENAGGALGLADIMEELPPDELEPALLNAKVYAKAQIALQDNANTE